MFFDYFVLQHRLSNGKTVVEQFVAARTDLPDVERELLGWRDVVEEIFEVRQRDGEALVVENLIDDLAYRVRSNMGSAVFRQMPRRSYLLTRLVPIGAEWLISGATSVMPASHRERIYRLAAEFAMRQPTLMFRNPEKLAHAWKLQACGAGAICPLLRHRPRRARWRSGRGADAALSGVQSQGNSGRPARSRTGSLLRRPGFDWQRDGEDLMRERKPRHFDRPAVPSFSPISERLASYASRL